MRYIYKTLMVYTMRHLKFYEMKKKEDDDDYLYTLNKIF